ncbi:MAG TPA: hypothetical protein VLB01_00510 [Thermodesulfobacteriota bacterium]|nr:hypothetical protein [Thermodesulfobacteriota bacterium]
MPIAAVIFLLLQIAFGFLFLTFLDPENKLSRAEIFFKSVVLGLAASSFLLLLLLLVLRSWSAVIPLLWVLLIISGIFTLWKRFRSIRFRTLPGVNLSFIFSFSSLGLLAAVFLYSAILLGVFILDGQGFPLTILKGWGDSAYHLDMISRLKTADPFTLEQPIVAGERLTYPFVVNLLSAVYERIGFSRIVAWHLPVFLFGISFLFLVFLFGKRIFENSKYAFALVLLVFFGGGMGFIWFFQDLWVAWGSGGASAFFSTLTDPPHEYTHLDIRTGGKPSSFNVPHNIVWIVPVISFLSHQRSFVSGTSVATIIFFGFLLYRGSPKLWGWGAPWGMIPFLHTHTFIAVTIILVFWFFYDVKNWLSWLKGGVLGTILALPQVIYLASGGLAGLKGPSFFKPWLGWMMCTHYQSWYSCDPNVEDIDLNPFWFWTKNFGLVFWGWILAICALIIPRLKEQNYFSGISPFLLPSFALFLLPHIMLFQPWEFDNNKILFYWWILASVSSIFLFQNLSKGRRIISTVFIIFIMLSIFSGMVDVLARISDFRENHYGYYGAKEVEVAEWIKENTEPNARFLTGDDPTQFIPMLTGRSIYLGYPGWLWSQGKRELTEFRRERALSFLSSGNPALICGDGIRYILWDSDLIRTYPNADYNKVRSASNVVFSQDIGSEKREILKIQCTRY